jgi:hypothetical protein
MRRFFTLLALPALGLPAIARGQATSAASPSDSDRVTARALAHEGYEAETHGQYAEAADRFQRAEALVHAPTLELGLARAQAGLGKLVEAHETYRRIVREELPAGAPAPFAKAVDDARRELAALEPRLAWVAIEVRGPQPSSTRVSVDEESLPAAALGTRRASNPGEHHVRASAPGFAPAESTFTVAEGETKSVSLTETASVEPAAPPPPPVVEKPAPAPVSSTPFGKTAGIALLGIGAAGLVTGGVTGVLALNKHASLSGDCPNGHCLPGESHEVALYNTFATVSTVSFVAGAVGVVSGFTLLLATPKAGSVTAYAGFLDAGITGRF